MSDGVMSVLGSDSEVTANSRHVGFSPESGSFSVPK